MTKVINPNTPDFVPASQRIGIDQYITDNPDNATLIENTILNRKAVLIDAPTGSGKSFVMCKLFNQWINEGRRCYYLLPKIIQQHQFAKNYLAGIPVINAQAEDDVKEAARSFGANITWQGFLMSDYDKDLTENDIVVVDEAHLLINNQSFIAETKQLVRKLQQGKYRVVLMSGTPNFIALKDLFKCEILSFYINQPPPRRIQPYVIGGKLMDNVTQYLRSLDFSGDGLHIIRVNDKNKHRELSQWAVTALNLNESQIQTINKDAADNRWESPDYQYLIDSEAIGLDIKLLITTVFADEGININNANINSIAIFYDPRLKKSNQRCRDSVIQFCSRFRNLHLIDNYNLFAISLFLPELPEGRETQHYFKVLDVQERSAKRLVHQLMDTRRNHSASMVMQSFPKLFDGTDPQANLVIEVGDAYFTINRQGIYFNTKSLVDLFKSNVEFLSELSAYFEIKPVVDFVIEPNGLGGEALKSARERSITAKIEAFQPLKETPADVLSFISKQKFAPEELLQLGAGVASGMQSLTFNIQSLSPMLVKSIEEDATRLLFLKKINFPINELAGLLMRKHEFHAKLPFLRFMLSRAAGTSKSMDNLYYVSYYEPLARIIGETAQQFVGQGFQPKSSARSWIAGKISYYLKTKKIDASVIIDELFVTEERRITVDGKKSTYISFTKERDINDVTKEFLFYNEQYYPTIDEIKPIAEQYNQWQQEFNVQQGEYRNEQIEPTTGTELITVGKARTEMERSKKQLWTALMANPTFLHKAEKIALTMVDAFKNKVDGLGGITTKLDRIELPEATKPLSDAA